MASDVAGLASQTLQLLEWRLQRLQFLLNGSSDKTRESSEDQLSIRARLSKLEQSLHKLSLQDDVVSGAVRLGRMQPQLLSRAKDNRDLAGDRATPTQTLTTVLAAAPVLQSTAAQLRAMSDLAPPPAAAFASLVALSPRIDAAAQRQEHLEGEIAELRKRSARVVVRWHEGSVQCQMRCWADWEARVRAAEREICRRERREQG